MIVIKPKYDGIGFNESCYSVRKLHGMITKEEFENVVYHCSKVSRDFYHKKRTEETHDYLRLPRWASLASLFFTFLAIILLAEFVYSNDDNYSKKWGALICIIMAMGLGILAILKSLATHPTFIDRDEETQKALIKYFDKINKEVWMKRGLFWTMGKDHYWLELRKLKKMFKTETEEALNSSAISHTGNHNVSQFARYTPEIQTPENEKEE